MGEGSQLTELVVGIMSSSAPILAAVAALFFYVHKLMQGLRQELNRQTESLRQELHSNSESLRQQLGSNSESLRQELVGQSESLRRELGGRIDNGLAEARLERTELRKDIKRVEVNVALIAGHVLGADAIKDAMTEDEAA